MARFTETEQIRPAATIAFDASSLVNKLETFSQQQSQLHAQQTAERAFQRGQEAALTGGDPEFKEEAFFGSVEAKAYNKGLRASYLASLDRDNREEIGRIVAENPDNLSAFNDQVESYRKSMMANVDPSARVAVADSIDSLISANRLKVQNNEIAKTHKENALEVAGQIEAATRDALGFARDGDDNAAGESALAAAVSLQGAVDAGFMTQDEAADQWRGIERSLVEEKTKGGVFGILDAEGIQAAYDSLNELADNRQKGFTPDEWDKVIAETQTELNRRVSRMEKDAVSRAKQQKKEMDFEAIRRRYEDGDDTVIVNPKVADAYYQEVLSPKLQGVPQDIRQAVQAQYIDRLKMVPDTLVKQVTNAANSNNPELLAEAASLIDRIDDIPGVVNKVPTDQQAYVQTVVDLMENMEPAEAVELARKATDPKDKGRIEAVKTKLKEIKKDDPEIYLDRAEGAFKSFFTFGDPDVDELSRHKMAEEYQALAENFMLAGAEEDVAFKKADKMIQRNWGETEVMGRSEVMKYPPEDYYSIDGDVDWIKPQLMKDIAGDVAGHTPQRVVLMSNDRTARTAKLGQPSYAVKVMIDGVFYNLGDWTPDYESEVKKRNEEKVEKALDRRMERLEKSNLDRRGR